MSAAAVLALTGCAADYVGDDWQCPLAQGRVCASVAAADPAVPETRVPATLAPLTRGTASPVDDVPLYRRVAAGAPAGRVDEPACRSDCDPFAWLAGLFAGLSDSESGEAGRTDAARDVDIEDTGATVSQRKGQPGTAGAGQTAIGAHATGSTVIASGMPDDAPPLTAGEAAGDARTDDVSGPSVVAAALRTGEVVARIWIAPFVDADGIYREGSWVRAVIAPAEWRLP